MPVAGILPVNSGQSLDAAAPVEVVAATCAVFDPGALARQRSGAAVITDLTQV